MTLLYQNVKNSLSFPVFFFPGQLRNRDTFLDLFLINIVRSIFCDLSSLQEQLIFQCGFKRFTASPIFSQHNAGNKFKVSI